MPRVTQRPSSGQEKGTLVIEDEALKHGFVMLPRVVLCARNLSRDAKLLYGFLLHYAWQNDECFPGVERLAHDLQMGVTSVWACMRELKEVDLVETVRRGLGRTNLYRLKAIRLANLDDQELQPIEDQELQPAEDQEPRPIEDKVESRKVESVEKETEETDSNLSPLDRFDEEDRPIEAYLRGVAAELHDEAPFKSTLTRALKIWGDTELYSEEFVQKMGEAKKRTQKYSGSIRKKAEKAGGLLPTKNKMPYFFSVLEDMLGLTRQSGDRGAT